ncbi:WD40 repeat protein [Ceratobasidium sp. AG-Ba]|nr:WD40 repeat protein [Ceratobasidium sp. AG-Ba]
MPAFFSSSKRKRKRDVSTSKPSGSTKPNGKEKRTRRDEELADDIDPGESGDEDEGETPAEKRLRLARMVLEDKRKELVTGDEVDAAEIDRELLASRLRQDIYSTPHLDGSITKWSLSTMTHIKNVSKLPGPKGKGKAKFGTNVEGHVDEVLALALSLMRDIW